MKLTAAEVAKIAQLARLKLTDTETTLFQDQLSEVLSYMEQLNEVDTTGTDTTAQVTGLQNVLADDTVTPSGLRDDLLKLPPARDGSSIEVPAVFEGGGHA